LSAEGTCHFIFPSDFSKLQRLFEFFLLAGGKIEVTERRGVVLLFMRNYSIYNSHIKALIINLPSPYLIRSLVTGTEGIGLAVGGACLLLLLLGSSPHVHACHPAVSYMFTGFAGCSVGRGISCGARKLARTPT
jgi:hypothetical protein